MKTLFKLHLTNENEPLKERLKSTVKSLWRGFTVSALYVYESGAFSAVYLVAGIASAFFYPTLAPAFLCLGGTLFATILVVKISDRYHFTIIEDIKTQACAIPTRYAKLHLVAFIFAIAVSYISPIIGGAVGVAVGVTSGLIIQIERVKRLREINGERINHPKPKVKENLVFA